jgi:hypothetical protein
MQVSLASTELRRAGFTMLVGVGWAAWAAPGPWQRSQPTFHSVTDLFAML